jgi:Trk-type K+ transport system membrane component
LLIAVGAASLVLIETTRYQQLRFPREQTPGRLLLTDSAPATQPTTPAVTTRATAPTTPQVGDRIVFSAGDSERAMEQQLRYLSEDKQWLAAVYQSIAARSGGVRTVRLDEHSLAPAGRAVLMAEMLIGGGLGGTARGLTLMVVVLLLAAVFRPTGPAELTKNHQLLRARMSGIALAGGAAMVLMTVTGVVAVVLIYRETAGVEACWFEAVSACCNSGLSMGITSQLSLEGKVALIAGMLLGRVLPLCVLMRTLKQTDA